MAQTISKKAGSKLIYIVRHGKTEWNQEGKVQGQKDSPLTQEGIDSSHVIGENIGMWVGNNPCIVYSSDLGRAVQTCEIICEYIPSNLGIIQTPDLRERCYGKFDGESKDSFTGINVNNPTLETYEDVYNRMYYFVQCMKLDGSDVIIICHQASGRILIQTLLEEVWSNPSIGYRLKHNQVAVYEPAFKNIDIITLEE